MGNLKIKKYTDGLTSSEYDIYYWDGVGPSLNSNLLNFID